MVEDEAAPDPPAPCSVPAPERPMLAERLMPSEIEALRRDKAALTDYALRAFAKMREEGRL